jgi:hypothetical protein
MMKNLSAEFVFGGYSVRKNTAVLSRKVDNKIYYDKFLYTYIENNLSFYILMDDGTYMNVETNDRVPLLTAEDLMSRHLRHDEKLDEEYERDKIIGVFGIRNMETLIKQVDEMNIANNADELRLKGLIEPKKAYLGMEINATISSFNKAINRVKGEVMVPPIRYGEDDTYNSVIGDELDFFDFMSNKDDDNIIDDLIKLNNSMDGVDNIKDGKEIVITKGTDGEAGTVEIRDNYQ